MSAIWRIGLYTKRPNEEIAICSLCNESGIKSEFSVKDSTTSTIIRHLKAQHKESIYFTRFTEMTSSKSSEKITQHFQPTDASVGSLEKRVVNFVACNLTSFKCINDPTLHALIKYGNPSAEIKDETYYRKTALPQIYHIVKQKVISMIKEFEYVSFTTDAWSGPSDSYLSLTITGISSEWKRISLPLAVSHFPGSHTSVAIYKKIHDLIDSFQIEPKKCHVFLRDGGANMKKCFETSEFFHADCGAHLLNLVVRESLKAEPISNLLKSYIADVHHVVETTIDTFSLVLNVLLMYLIKQYSTFGVKIYKYMLTIDALLDLCLSVFTFFAQPIALSGDGYLTMTSNGFFAGQSQFLDSALLSLFCFTLHTNVLWIPVQFVYRYRLLCKNKYVFGTIFRRARKVHFLR
ncbi:serpentine type 7TM GPCR chemoreceptor str domain-containing protein [Ditylenchus destructor]|uniref:Serpentine type 7TM GPCR chemoreceptor str domain-containing protein n=1 Tax=Ditylenchus destructor TaxID=166010 RepID=A0AAD4MNE6_9BILA|nr:serpentine type 7TM GPCR chemoreceptor str domain-containing protein [Ditylenchus destructor]